VATLAVEKTQAVYRIQRSPLFPTVGVLAEGERYRIPEKENDDGVAKTSSAYSVNLGTTAWELDLFGRIRRQTEAAQARVYATDQARRGVILSVVTSVATSYVSLLGLDSQLKIARETLDSYAGTLKIFELRYAGGVVSKVELSQVQSEYEVARAGSRAWRPRLSFRRT